MNKSLKQYENNQLIGVFWDKMVSVSRMQFEEHCYYQTERQFIGKSMTWLWSETGNHLEKGLHE